MTDDFPAPSGPRKMTLTPPSGPRPGATPRRPLAARAPRGPPESDGPPRDADPAVARPTPRRPPAAVEDLVPRIEVAAVQVVIHPQAQVQEARRAVGIPPRQ